MLLQERAVSTQFSIETFQNLFDRSQNDATIERAIEVAAKNPVQLYYFMQRYAYFNSFAGSLVARLASSIGLSYNLFRQKDISVADQSDRGLEIAAKVFAATIDEHADAGAERVPHRTLAQATLKAVGEYAQLNEFQLNQAAQNPEWMDELITIALDGYPGKIGDVEALATAIGFHIGSELLADREYAIIDKVVRYTNRGTGFDAWLKGKQVTIGSKRLSPWYWIVVHGQHNSAGVEADHSEFAVDALNLLAQYRPESAETILKWASKGFLDFARVQERLFQEIESEISTLTPQSINSVMN
jgi:hypothetical protein